MSAAPTSRNDAPAINGTGLPTSHPGPQPDISRTVCLDLIAELQAGGICRYAKFARLPLDRLERNTLIDALRLLISQLPAD